LSDLECLSVRNTCAKIQHVAGDPLSQILQLARVQTVISGGFVAGGAWSLRFPAPQKLKIAGVVRGECQVAVEGLEPVDAIAGDVFLLSESRSLVYASDLTQPSLDATKVFTRDAGALVSIGGGDDVSIIGGHVELDPASRELLLDVLPPLVHVRAPLPQAQVLQWLLEQLVSEQTAALPGASIVASQLAQLMFVQALRLHLDACKRPKPGWLRAVTDERLIPAIRLMHDDPGRAWQLEELARASAMSRSTFAQRFRESAGIAPLAYLTQWRMRLASRSLSYESVPVSDLARRLGYASESAFSNAFKRIVGMSPRHYRYNSKPAS